EIVDSYLAEVRHVPGQGGRIFEEDPEKDAQLRSVRLLDHRGNEAATFDCDNPIVIELTFQVHRSLPGLYGYLELLRTNGTCVMVSDSLDCRPNPLDSLPVGMHRIRISVPPRTLGHGDYDVYLNFNSASSFRGHDVDAPGVVATFRLDDLTSNRGNHRHGF